MKYFITIYLSLFLSFYINAQENTAGNISSIPYFINPSFYSMSDLGKIGFIYQTETQSIGSQEEKRLLFGSYNFEKDYFTLGFDIDSRSFKNTGFNETRVSGHYIYNLDINSQWAFYPSISLSFISRKFQSGNVFLEDQINILTGEINLNSSDPLLGLINNQSYISIGAGAVVHNSYNQMFGINIKNINNPNQSIIEGAEDKLKFLTSFQHSIVFDLNRYKQSPLLPTFTYLQSFINVSNYGSKMRFDLQQRLSLNDFYITLNEQLNKIETLSLHKIGLGAGVYIGSIEYGFNYNFNSSSINAVPFKTLEFSVSFDISPVAGRYRGDRSPFRHY